MFFKLFNVKNGIYLFKYADFFVDFNISHVL